MNNTAVPGTQAVRRAVSVLKAFDDDHPEWSAADLARFLDLNRTTAYRLLRALEEEGLLLRHPESDAYRLGPEAIALGARAARSSDLRSAARRALESLAEAVGETSTLEVLAGGETLILDEVPGPSVLAPAVSIGTRWPAHATSTGKVLLADALAEGSAAGWADGLPRRLPRYTERTLVSREALRRELEEVARRGFATAGDELEVGFVAVAAPVRDGRGEVVAALSVGGPASRLTAERMPEVASRVRAAGEEVSRRLGARPRGAARDGGRVDGDGAVPPDGNRGE